MTIKQRIQYFLKHRLLMYWYHYLLRISIRLGLYETDLYWTMNSWMVRCDDLDVDKLVHEPKNKDT